MVSDVKGPGPRSITPHESTSRKVGGGAETPQGTAAAKSDVVTLTDLSARLKRLTDAVEKLPVVDQIKVGELREAIEGGSYAVDERVIAEKLAVFEALIAAKDSER